ncbi:PQQ-binding-like beta-propeller repeat protein [Streptomyces sp. NPDC088253]|uniref:outer membrane protein assembly factor BamB family protein n=1 Tax=Streptomyces sp. NPDC088253 TaxID=3365846 RepID=UPI00380AE917
MQPQPTRLIPSRGASGRNLRGVCGSPACGPNLTSRIARPRGSSGHGLASRAAPASMVAEGTVYIGSEDMSLWAVDAATGEERWRPQAHGELHSTPVVADGTVYVGSLDDFLYVIHT